MTYIATPAKFLGYDAIVGLSNQSGTTHTSIASAITAAPSGGRILILSGTYTETIAFAKQLTIEGVGRSTVLSGTLTLNDGSDWSKVTNLRVTGNIVIAANANSIFIRGCWQDAAGTLTNSGTGNSILLIRE